jgi:hypothetical protein
MVSELAVAGFIGMVFAGGWMMRGWWEHRGRRGVSESSLRAALSREGYGGHQKGAVRYQR